MLKNAYLLAKIGADTAENEQHFAEISWRDVDDPLPRRRRRAARSATREAAIHRSNPIRPDWQSRAVAYFDVFCESENEVRRSFRVFGTHNTALFPYRCV